MKPLAPPVQSWLDRLPPLEEGRRRPGVDPELAAKLFEEILAAGPDGVVALIDTLNETDDGRDWKTRLILHGLVTHTRGPGKTELRLALEKVLAGELGANRPAAIRTFLARELGWLAGEASREALAEQLSSVDPDLVDAATASLIQIGAAAHETLEARREQVDVHARRAIDHALAEIERRAWR